MLLTTVKFSCFTISFPSESLLQIHTWRPSDTFWWLRQGFLFACKFSKQEFPGDPGRQAWGSRARNREPKGLSAPPSAALMQVSFPLLCSIQISLPSPDCLMHRQSVLVLGFSTLALSGCEHGAGSPLSLKIFSFLSERFSALIIYIEN